MPLLGQINLNAIGNEDVQRLKSNLSQRSPKTVNNILTVLNTLLRVAVEWQVVEQMPCRIRLLRVPPTHAAFYDFDEYGQLVEAALIVDVQAHLLVLLGGDAGLRCGEIIALEWTDVDLGRRQLTVQRSEWKGKVTATKGGRPRVVPLTRRLTEALRAHKHLRSPRVLCREGACPATQRTLRTMMKKVIQTAGVGTEGIHILRHTFCSHLAMRGAPARAIQELAGHRDLSTTQRYMHLSPAAVQGAIRLLEQPTPVSQFGDILETERVPIRKVSD